MLPPPLEQHTTFINQPGVYRSIINDVITHISADFEEYGMEAELLERLQAKWEENLRATKVADFPSPQGENGQAPAEPPAPTFSGLNGASAAQPSTTDVHVKNEPDDALRLRGGAVRISSFLHIVCQLC
jgi:hypothetical protein